MNTTTFNDARPAATAAPRRLAIALPFDPLLLMATLGIAVCSLVVINGATRSDIAGNPHYYLTRQAIYFGVGFALMGAISRVDITRLRELKYAFYGFLLLSIFAVMAVGTTAKGAQRAIPLPFFQFQASELGKVLLVLALASFVVDRSRRIGERDTTARVMLVMLVPASLVIAQPDLGSGLVYIVIALAMLFVAGTSLRHFGGLAVLGTLAVTAVLVGAPAAGVGVLKPYQKARLTAFLNPKDNPAEQGYQQIQSKIAIGAGQKTGRGNQATQTKFNFLPEHHTDFIFAVVGERYGFIGAAFVLLLYALLIWRALRILTVAKNLFSALVAGGIVAMLMFQVFINVGMTLGIMPITGITLPLLSYGGSSVLTTMLAIGLLQSISVQGRLASAYKARTIL